MGWTSYQATYFTKRGTIDRKAECDAYFMEGLNAGHYKVLKSTMHGSVYYAAVKDMVRYVGRDGNGKSVYEPIEDGSVWAAVFLTSVKGREFYYKDMDETCGPCYYDCPKSILSLLSETDSEWANEWRKKCIEESEKPSLASLPIGTTIRVKFGEREVLATKHAPAYQFRRPFWMTGTGYLKHTMIKTWEVVNP